MGTNNGNHGKKGRSGRKSAYQERADADFIQKIFFRDNTPISELQAKIKSGKYSIKDVLVLKAKLGSETILKSILEKATPTKIDHGTGIPVKNILSQEADEDTDQSEPVGEDDGQTPDHRGQASPTDHVPAESDSAVVPPTADA